VFAPPIEIPEQCTHIHVIHSEIPVEQHGLNGKVKSRELCTKAKEAAMTTALTSGLNFISGIALQLGTVSTVAIFKSGSAKPQSGRVTSRRNRVVALTKSQKMQLLESIRHDDWAE
jgi:microcystin-dependent protein